MSEVKVGGVEEGNGHSSIYSVYLAEQLVFCLESLE